MSKETLKERIIREMVIGNTELFNLAKEIYKENYTRLKDGTGINEIYTRLLELSKLDTQKQNMQEKKG